jgi:alpha-galactosidase
LVLDFLIDCDRHISLNNVRLNESTVTTYELDKEVEHALPLTQIRLLGEGSNFGTSERQVYSTTSSRLVYVSHKESTECEDTQVLDILTRDPVTRLEVLNKLFVCGDIPVVRSTAIASNTGLRVHYLETFAPLSIGFLNRGSEQWFKDYQVAVANSTNFREAQWKTFNFPDLGMDWVGESDFDKPGTRASISRSNLGTFSTAGSLPMGAITRKDGKHSIAWQIESSGSWQWELGNIMHGLYLIASGPNDQNHQWTRRLDPGDTFTSVSTAMAVANNPLQAVFGPFTQYRRRIRRKHADNDKLPLIFNDYMKCLKGSDRQLQIVVEGCEAYKRIRHYIKASVPFWPLGMDQWNEPWVVLGLQPCNHIYLGVWRRGGEMVCRIPLPQMKGRKVSVEIYYPKNWKTEVSLLPAALDLEN